MPAAKPSQKSIMNVLSAAAAAGLTTGAIHVGTDGSFRVEFGPHSEKELVANNDVRDEAEDAALGWDEVA